MITSLKVNNQEMGVEIDAIETEIDTTVVELTEGQILFSTIALAKLKLLIAYDAKLTLGQFEVLANSLPHSIFFNLNTCYKCGQQKTFNEANAALWEFDEKVPDEAICAWVCPECRANKIAATAKDAGAKAAAIQTTAAQAEKGGEPEGDVCAECKTPLKDGKCPTEDCPMFGMDADEGDEDEDGDEVEPNEDQIEEEEGNEQDE